MSRLFVASLALLMSCGSAASAATFNTATLYIATDANETGFAYTASQPVTAGTTSTGLASYCTYGPDCTVTLQSSVANAFVRADTVVATVPNIIGPGFPDLAVVNATFQAGTLAQAGRYAEPGVGNGDKLVVVDLPSYTRGSYLYAYSVGDQALALIAPGAIGAGKQASGATVFCSSGFACELTLSSHVAGDAVSFEEGRLIGVPAAFPGLALGTEGFYQTSDGNTTQGLAVIALPDQYAAPVPEPAAWMMLVAGFGLIGGAVRGRRASVAAA